MRNGGSFAAAIATRASHGELGVRRCSRWDGKAVLNWIKRRRESRRLAAKHAAWRAELDNLGVWAVQKRVDQAGEEHGALVYRFTRGPIEYEFIELWLGEKEQAAVRQQAATLRWARIAGWAGMLAVLLCAGMFAVFLTILLTPEGRDTLRRVATSLSAWLFK